MSPRKVALRGEFLLDSAELNKGTAFTDSERRDLDLTSRLPLAVNSLDTQCERAWAQLQDLRSPMHKNEFLWSMKSQNWVLFYALISRHLTDLFPIIYTPTEADAIASYSHVFRRPQGGIFLSYPRRETLEQDFKTHLLDAKGNKRKIDLVVVSDGEAILGIGDQGAGGIGISTAKAVIYTLAAGVHPGRILSIVLDVGTNNKQLLEDDLYVGWKHERLTGKPYDEFIDSFVKLCEKELGDGALLHFEDFGTTNAKRILDRYHDTHAIFNDDVQGTGAVTLAALESALKVTGEKITDQRIIIFGAGSAGLGIASQLRQAITLADESLSDEDASSRFWLVDKEGLLTSDMKDVRDGLVGFTRKDWKGDKKSLEDVVREIHPTVLIGTSTSPGAFTQSIIKEMSKHVDRPIIFPLSNPTRLCEVHPRDANEWSKGKALLATGSPFDPVKNPEGGPDYVIAECNNALLYPGLCWGAILGRSKVVSDTMIVAATKALAKMSPAAKDPNASLLPDFGDSRDVNFKIALAVLDQSIEEGSATVDVKKEDREKYARDLQWNPEYEEFVYDAEGDL
ncbi:hypothetical protein BDY24DRAFT_386327 [Mrakia frigida]|uniref:NAD-dependent malic enzyme n=1 Tax=Mrakia frigida TaxID=29902 RepID=UPI003FCC175A